MSVISDHDKRAAAEFLAQTSQQDLHSLIEFYPECQETELRQNWISLANYLRYRQQGIDHVWAAMRAVRRGPRMKGSDRGFNEHARHRMSTMNNDNLVKLLRHAKQAGINTQGKFYVGGLADRRGARDPRAWVSTTDEILSVCKQRNYEATGCVTNRAHDVPPPAKVPLAADIVDDLVREKCQADPELNQRLQAGGQQALRTLREAVVEKHSRRQRR